MPKRGQNVGFSLADLLLQLLGSSPVSELATRQGGAPVGRGALCNYWRNVEVPAVLNQLCVERGEKVLDLGSPKLPSLFIWDRLGAEVWATDLFPYFFEEYTHYKERLQDTSSGEMYHIETQDARKLAYPDSHFDKVYAISVLEHIEDDGDSATMPEIARVLKCGGCAALRSLPRVQHSPTVAPTWCAEPA